MTYTLKVMTVTALFAATLAAQTVGASAKGSDREPGTTNMIVHDSATQRYPTQKNAVIRFETIVGYTDYNVFNDHQTFADQK